MSNEKMIKQKEEYILLLIDAVACASESTKYEHLFTKKTKKMLDRHFREKYSGFVDFQVARKEAVAWLSFNPQAYGGEL